MCDLLKCKSDLAHALEKRLKLISNLNKGEGVVMFVSDNGGEYSSKHTQRMLAENGVMYNPAAPESQFQNGVSERHVGMISKLVLKMFLRCTPSNVPLAHWCYAVMMAVHLINMRLAYNGKSMHESFFGTRMSNKHALEFGQVCLCKATRAHADKCTPKDDIWS